jgi:Ca-activated chloride channel family protein
VALLRALQSDDGRDVWFRREPRVHAGGLGLVTRFQILTRGIQGWHLIVAAAALGVGVFVAANYLPRGVPGLCSPKEFRIVAGSGNATFETILKRFGEEQCVRIEMTYKGSLDIMTLLETGNVDHDAIWDADSLWTTMGDTHRLIKNRESIMRSPVVFGIKRPIAEKLGWIGKDISVQDILNAAEDEDLRLMMTSATQSNSGASSYLGFLYAFARPNNLLTSADLQNPEVQAKLKKLLMSINRTSESSGWLRDLFAKEYDRYDGMFNYESHIIELNQNLLKQNREPLFIVYPSPGLGIADFPLSYVSHGDTAKEATFNKLQEYLLSPSVQKELAAKGRRVGVVGMTPESADRAVFNPDWGVDLKRIISPLRLPDTPVIREALNLYQTVLRKPSFTVYALDFSGSMTGDGESQLKQAMRTLLDQNEARKYLLQNSDTDIIIVISFDDTLLDIVSYGLKEGDGAENLDALLKSIEDRSTSGGTNIYAPIAKALQLMKENGVDGYLPAIILMTDGKSNDGSILVVKAAQRGTQLTNVPVYGITFGSANANQLDEIAEATGGRVFDGTKDLISAFRRAKGNN